MEIKHKFIFLQFVILFVLFAITINVINKKTAIISPLAKIQNPILSNSTNSIKPKISNTPTYSPTQTLTPTPSLTPFPTLSFNDLEGNFEKYSNQFSVAKDLLKHIASCESGFNSNSINGDYVGMFQFSTQTWINNRNALGVNPDPNLRLSTEESIKTAAFMIARNLTKAWPNCSK